MKYSLATCDLIADSTEAMALAHGFNGLVMVPNCDKNVPTFNGGGKGEYSCCLCQRRSVLAGRIDGRKTSLSICLKR